MGIWGFCGVVKANRGVGFGNEVGGGEE